MLAYWLAHSEGFRVDSPGGSGTVERLFVEPSDGHVTALAIRSGPLGRRTIVPSAVVASVDPAERVLAAEHPLGSDLLRRALVRGLGGLLGPGGGHALAGWLGRLTATADARTTTSRSSSRTRRGAPRGCSRRTRSRRRP